MSRVTIRYEWEPEHHRTFIEVTYAGGYSPELTEAIDVLHELEAFTK